jgi:hypothetical protein
MDRDNEFLSALHQTALAAQREEISFRNNVAREIASRELARKYAFRRLSLAELMVQAARRAESEEQAIAAQAAALRTEMGWHGDTEQRRRIFAAWRPVAMAAWDAVRPRTDEPSATPAERPDIAAALATFEAWYLAEFGSNYLDILEVEIQELPVVEF